MSCLRTQHSASSESQTSDPSISSPHSTTEPLHLVWKVLRHVQTKFSPIRLLLEEQSDQGLFVLHFIGSANHPFTRMEWS